MGSFAGFLPLVSFKTAAYQSGAASQHIISAKQVWRTALKTTGRLFEQLALKETQQVQFKLVLLHIKSTRRFIWTIIHIVLPISSILKESH
ncbi:MAG: hypothetical protein BWX52_01730 [Bacteroidetes bacterium ADurb.Bin013]|nr:MAG: hypothetical protein BWX52_01730 [Bacteroidetes bacterium ADurb.Bin013]